MSELNEIFITLNGVGQAIAKSNLEVPAYQRPYAWEDKHAQDLFQDLSSAVKNGEKEYFLGSIVVIEKGTGRLQVVDGQQRMATTSILLAAIRDYLHSTGDIDRSRYVEQSFLFNRDLLTLETMPRLRLNDVDNDFYCKRILSLPGSVDRRTPPIKDSHVRIAKAAELAAAHIENIVKHSSAPTPALVEWVKYVEQKAKVIWVQVPDDANAFTIFETLNDRGLDLAVSDLLKNYLLGQSQSRMNEVLTRWITMTGALEAVDSEALVVPYIRHLWASEYGVTREKDLYKRMKEQISGKQKAVDFAGKLEKNARLYAAILNPVHELWNAYGPTASGHMRTLNELRMEQIRPLILAILDTFQTSEVQRSLRLMVSWAARLLISGGLLGGGVLENSYSQLAIKVRHGDITSAKQLSEELKVVPSDSQFQSKFAIAYISKANLARYYLRVLENQARGDPEPALIPNSNQEVVNLEHILPQNPSSAWDHIDAETSRDYYNRLGNLALLQSRQNTLIGNAGFDDKRSHYADSPFLLTREVADYAEWGPQQIDERQAYLAELAVEAWPIKV